MAACLRLVTAVNAQDVYHIDVTLHNVGTTQLVVGMQQGNCTGPDDNDCINFLMSAGATTTIEFDGQPGDSGTQCYVNWQKWPITTGQPYNTQLVGTVSSDVHAGVTTLSLNLQANGQGCPYSVSVHNSSPVENTYAIQYVANGFGQTAYLNVGPGATAAYSWTDALCTGSNAVVTLMATFNPTPPTTPVQGPPGELPPPPVGPYPPITTPPVNGGTPADPEPPPPAYNPTNTWGTNNPINTNGPIIYPGAAPTNGQGTNVLTGLDAIYVAVNKDDQDVVAAIRQLDSDVTNNATANESQTTNWLGQLHRDLTNLDLTNGGNPFTNTGPWTNLDTNFDVAAASNSAVNLAGPQASNLTNGFYVNPALLPETPTGIGDMTLSIPLPSGAMVIDCNPLHMAGVPALASWCRTAFTFLIALFCLRDAWTALEAYIVASGQPRQATSAGEEIFGWNAAIIGAQAMAIAITVTIAAVPAFAITWAGTTNFAANITSGLFQTSEPAIANGVGLLNAFFPIDYCVTSLLTVFGFRVGCGGVWWVVTAIIRHLTGI